MAMLTANWTLESLPPEVARILSVISLLHPTAIQEEILISLPEKAQLPNYPQTQSACSIALRQLESSSIITRRPATATNPAEISIHPDIQSVVRGKLLTTQIGMVAVFNATVRLLSTIWPFETLPGYGYQEVNQLGRRVICNRNLPHIKSLRRIYDSLPIHARQSCANVDFLNLLSEMGWFYHQRFNPEEALDYIQATLAVHETCVGEKHPHIVAAQYGTWNAIAKELNDPKLAMETGMKSLTIREQLFAVSGIPDSQIVASYASAGLTYLMNRRDEEAEQFVNKSMALRKQMPNYSRLQLYSPLVYLSLISLYRGKLEDAADYLLEALSDREAEYGIDDHESMRTGTLLAYLGKVRTLQGRLEEGLKYYERAFNSWCAAGGKHDYSMGRLYYWLAMYYFRTKSLETAATFLDQAIKIFSRSGYHQCEHARALFLKSQCLRNKPETEEASAEALTESAALRRGFCGDNLVAMENLEIRHFDEYVALWNR